MILRFMRNAYRVISSYNADGIRIHTFARFFMLQFLFRLKRPKSVLFLGEEVPFSFTQTGPTSTFYHGVNEPRDMLFLSAILNERYQFIDVGANIGLFTLLASKCNVSKIIAVEPDKSNFHQLKSNLKSWNVTNCSLFNCALGSHNGKVELFGHDVSVRAKYVSEVVSEGEGAVECLSLDGLISNCDGYNRIIKIDTEGFELMVLMGGLDTIAQWDTKIIIIEINDNLDSADDKREIFRILNQNGFFAYMYDMNNAEIIQIQDNFKRSENTIFIKQHFVDTVRSELRKNEQSIYWKLLEARRSICNFKM